MRTTDIVLRLHDQQLKKLEIGKPDDYRGFYNSLLHAIVQRKADIVHKGDYFRYGQHLLPSDTDTNDFITYVLFRDITLEGHDEAGLWTVLEKEAHRLDFLEIRETNDHHQLIELSALTDNSEDSTDSNTENSEDILIRIPGNKEILEFDPTGAEGNAILYSKLAKLIYDKEAEIMYKGPKLIFEDNKDLFINADAFSMYVLFRSERNTNYEEKELIWSNLAANLRMPSSITLLKSAENYHVLLFTPTDRR